VSGDHAAAAYGWTGGERQLDAFCVSVAAGASPAAAVAVFAADPASTRTVTFAGQRDMAAPYPDGMGNDTVAIDALAGAAVCAQANGWAGVDEARAAALSAPGPYIATYRSVNADMLVVVARDGRVVRAFDPLLYDGSGALREELGLPFGQPGKPVAAAFALAERLTGIRLTRAWLLEAPHPTYRRDPDA
jgi:Family of unknown function (DUF6461)